MKKIIGFIGDTKSGRTTAANILSKKGFCKVSINEKVSELASHLFTKEELALNKVSILNGVRKRGCSIIKEYWLNLVLVTIPDDAKFVIFDDISVEEAESDKIASYQIYRPGVSRERIEGIETIENDGSLKDFEKKIEELYKKIVSKKVARSPQRNV